MSASSSRLVTKWRATSMCAPRHFRAGLSSISAHGSRQSRVPGRGAARQASSGRSWRMVCAAYAAPASSPARMTIAYGSIARWKASGPNSESMLTEQPTVARGSLVVLLAWLYAVSLMSPVSPVRGHGSGAAGAESLRLLVPLPLGHRCLLGARPAWNSGRASLIAGGPISAAESGCSDGRPSAHAPPSFRLASIVGRTLAATLPLRLAGSATTSLRRVWGQPDRRWSLAPVLR